MNYIKFLNSAYSKFIEDDRLNASHISLYMALFQDWNRSRFATDFFINRAEVMSASKIASKTIYHRCLKELHGWGYIKYFPTNNPYKSSKASMVILDKRDFTSESGYDPILEQFEEELCTGSGLVEDNQNTSSEPPVDKLRTSNGQVQVSSLNGNKQPNNNKMPKDRQAILNFFKENGSEAKEGKKFLDYYRNRNWKTTDGKLIRDWRAVANYWMERDFKKWNNKSFKSEDNLQIQKFKSYDQPL